MLGLAQQEQLQGDIPQLLSPSAERTVMGWVRLGRSLGPCVGVKIPGEADQKTCWCLQDQSAQKVTV